MLIRAGYEISFDYPEPTAVLAMLQVHPSRILDLRSSEKFQVTPGLPYSSYVDLYGNR